MNKPFIYYTALTRAVDNYNDRKLYTRGKLADDLGFIGKNAAIQFSNALNPTNHDKTLNDEKKAKLLHTLEQEDHIILFNYYLKQFELKAVPVNTPVVTFSSLHQSADNAMIKGNELFKTVKTALCNKTRSRDDLESIVNEATKAEEAYAQTRIMAEKRLEEMEEEG